MKVVHVLKKIEDIDQDIRELKKLEKSVKKNKSFTTPIYMSIEKQINILLGDRIKMLELKIENPPEPLQKEIEGDEKNEKPVIPVKAAPVADQKKKEVKPRKIVDEETPDDDTMQMLTQDQIDAKINSLQAAKSGPEQNMAAAAGIKILDIALEKGTLGESEEDKKDKDKKVKFLRDNFPGE